MSYDSKNDSVKVEVTYKGKPVTQTQIDKDIEIKSALPDTGEVALAYRTAIAKSESLKKRFVIYVSEHGIETKPVL